MSLKCWNWRFRIFFDDKILAEVNDFVNMLNPEEKNIYKEIVNFYTGFYSVQILLDNMSECPERGVEYVAKAWENRDKIIFLPASLEEYYHKKITKMQITGEVESKLHHIVEYARGAESNYEEYLALCKITYGSLFEKMLLVAHVEGTEAINVPRGDSVKNEIREVYEGLYDEIIQKAEIIEKYGESQLCDFDVCVMQGQAFAEWWDEEISSQGRDVLILYQNEDSQYFNDLKYTIYHETYPGHGQFYKTLSDREIHLFDHGAISIVEGWATYAEWHSEDSDYIRAVRKNALYFLRLLSTHRIEDIDEILIQNKLKQGYSREAALQSVVNATQSIGFTECYYYGALWLEVFMAEKEIEPKEFLTFMNKHNVIEGFSIWNTIY